MKKILLFKLADSAQIELIITQIFFKYKLIYNNN